VRGIYIFNVTTLDEAAQLTQTDPAIQARSLVMELRLWYGLAALQQINELHNAIVLIVYQKSVVEPNWLDHAFLLVQGFTY